MCIRIYKRIKKLWSTIDASMVYPRLSLEVQCENPYQRSLLYDVLQRQSSSGTTAKVKFFVYHDSVKGKVIKNSPQNPNPTILEEVMEEVDFLNSQNIKAIVKVIVRGRL